MYFRTQLSTLVSTYFSNIANVWCKPGFELKLWHIIQVNFSQVVSESLYKYVFTTLSYANTKYKYIHTTRAIHISMMYQRTEIRQYVLWILFTLAWNNLWNKSLYVPLQIHLFKLFTTCLFYILRMCMTLECTKYVW